MVAHLNTQQKKVALVSVPRDTWLSVKIAEGQVELHKINEVYLVGRKAKDEEFGFQLIKQAIGEITGLPIHHFAFITFGKFKEAIDGLGGITVDVPVAFDDYFYPIKGRELEPCGWSAKDIAAMSATMSGFPLERQFSCRFEHIHFDAEPTKMNGETALKFVRSRHSSQHGGDFARSERQQAVIVGIKDKLLSLDGLKKAPEFFGKMVGFVRTDLDKEVVTAVAKAIVDPQQYTLTKIVLSTDNVFRSAKNSRGQFILVPKAGQDQWGETRQLIKKELGKENIGS
jgi:LCP family protein required for cell wall assembly